MSDELLLETGSAIQGVDRELRCGIGDNILARVTCQCAVYTSAPEKDDIKMSRLTTKACRPPDYGLPRSALDKIIFSLDSLPTCW